MAERRVLVIEDEFLVGSMLRSALQRAHFEVVGPIDTCERALAALSEASFQFATLDLTLRGGELSVPVARQLEHVGVPYVLVTGNLGDAVVEEYGLAPSRVLDKPFSIKKLVTLVAEAVDGDPPPEGV